MTKTRGHVDLLRFESWLSSAGRFPRTLVSAKTTVSEQIDLDRETAIQQPNVDSRVPAMRGDELEY